mgnify:CR=1 FL=1
MLTSLLLSTLLIPQPELNPAAQVCLDMEPELEQAVEFKLITDEQAADILIRCFINYSQAA